MASFDIGDLVRVSAAFTDPESDDQPVDPTGVTFRVRVAGGAVTIYTYGVDAEVVKDGSGNYHCDVAIDAGGTWYYRWAGTGAHQAAVEGRFDVQGSRFG